MHFPVQRAAKPDMRCIWRKLARGRFAKAVYVLHAFQKKSKKGISTPKSDIDLIKHRLRMAADHYQQFYGSTMQ
jgi:phage-related protein